MRTEILTHKGGTAIFATVRIALQSVVQAWQGGAKQGRAATLMVAVLGLLPVLLANTVLAQTYALQSQFGSYGNGLGQFQAPIGVAIDPITHYIAVADQALHRVQIFDSTGMFVSSFGSLGVGNGQFSEASGVAIDPTTEDIVVTDLGVNARVQIFDSNGTYVSQFGHVSVPDGVAIDPTTHDIVVVDDTRVVIFDSTGVLLGAFGSFGTGNGQFNTPIGVAIDPATRNIVVVDAVNNNAQVFSATGTYLSRFGSQGGGNGQFNNPNFVAIDPTTHNIIVSDGFNKRLQIFDLNGTYLSQIPVSGEPEGVAVDPTTHNIVVVNFTQSQVDIFAPTAVPTALDFDQHGLTGSWYEPATSGQGLELEVYPDLSPGVGLAQVSWFTYDIAAGGADHQRWYTLSGGVTSGEPNAALTIYQNTGGNFDALPTTTAHPVGTATLIFASCISGQLTYNFTDGSGRNGIIPLTRLTQNMTCATTGPPFATNTDFGHSGNWYDPSTSGQGFTVEVNPISGTLFAAWYTYAPMGAAAGAAGQRWYTAQATFTAGTRSIPVTIYETTGGIFNMPTTAGQQTVAVGTGTLTFQSCTAATFSYAFTGGSSTGLSGTINLSRVGPVPSECTS